MKPGESKTVPDDMIMLQEIVHICIVVKDVERTAETFSKKFGIGPFRISVVHTPSTRASVYGKPVSYTLKFGNTRVGPIRLELVQTLEGQTIYQDFLKEHGEGLHHIGVTTPLPFDAELQKWKKKGIEPLQVNKMENPEHGWAYMDTAKLVGCILEILSLPPR
jgi:methylmalonyl-CoA/ethylmalonyl-CoA epimerase